MPRVLVIGHAINTNLTTSGFKYPHDTKGQSMMKVFYMYTLADLGIRPFAVLSRVHRPRTLQNQNEGLLPNQEILKECLRQGIASSENVSSRLLGTRRRKMGRVGRQSARQSWERSFTFTTTMMTSEETRYIVRLICQLVHCRAALIEVA